MHEPLTAMLAATSPRVSVVIPTHDRAHSVGVVVRSVLAQDFRELECLVVDDGSADSTAAVLSEIADHRLRYIAGRHAGVSAARNLGVRHARGEVIAFLDSDDIWRSDKLTHDFGLFQRYPELDAVFTDLEEIDAERVYPSFMRETAVFSGRRNGVSRARRRGAVPARDVPRSSPRGADQAERPERPPRAFEATGGFDESWSSSEDWEFLLRLARTRRFGYIDRPLTVLRVGSDSLHRRDQARGGIAMIRLLERQRSLLAGDRENREAARQGLIARVKHFGWYSNAVGRRCAAAGVFLKGFVLTRSPGLLLRAAAALLPAC